MILSGTSGARWDIEDNYFDIGGEGKLYFVKGDNEHVVKLYKDGMLTSTRQEKLSYMTTLYSRDRFNQMAWPTDMVKDQSGQIKGFVMRRFGATEDMANLLDGSSNKSMNLNWHKRIVIALNLSLLVDEIHSMGQIIGDMNPQNFGVDMTNGFVCAFDTDSFHLYDRGSRKWYPCIALCEEYVAPELQERLQQGARLDTYRPEETWTVETDCFALAILIFQLLFDGTHPFTAARVPSRGSSVIVHNRDTNIYQRMSPFFNPSPNITIPVHTLPLSIVPSNMQNAFRRALLEDNRPQAREWVEMLKALRLQLTTCNNGHFYGKYNSRCPWCEKETSIPAPAPRPADVTNYTSSRSAAMTRTQPQSNPTQRQNPVSNGTYQIRKHRAWYAHEIIYLLAWILTFVFELNEAISTVTFGIALFSRVAKRKNETLPTGGGAKFLIWTSFILGCGAIYTFINSVSQNESPSSVIFILYCELAIYGLCSLFDRKP